ncbi:MAG: protein kinase [Myxococcales bacterium]|nr:protein kinase [Myxococcales bacterium]
MTESTPLFDTLVGKRIAGRYLVERLIGAGGMGIVAAAKYPELGQRVAIKFLRPELASDSVVTARFVREARVAAKVRSTHFVRVFDVGRLESGVPFLVMEMLSGRDLGDELAERGPLSIEHAVDYILQAAVALGELHALGIVHRDLKPSNLFLETGAGAPVLKVLDFGISKEQKTSDAGSPLTSTDHVLGTPQYMSPEQIRASKDVDARSDVWSLGVILYELLTKQLPFSTESGGVGEMFGKILFVDPEPLRSKREDLPEDLETVILKCMHRDRDGRYASVLELAEALRPFAAESALHRIDSVRQAAATPPPEPEDDDGVAAFAKISDPELPVANTRAATPESLRDGLVMAPTAPASDKDLARERVRAISQSEIEVGPGSAPVTSMTATGAAKAAPATGSRRGLVIGAIAASLLAVGGAVAVGKGSDTPASPAPSAVPPDPGAVTTSAAEPSATAQTPEPPTTPAPVASASAEPVVDTPTPSATTETTAKKGSGSAPRTKPVAVKPQPAVRPSASSAPKPAPTLILDRK